MIQDEIMKLQTYKMFEGEDTVYVERDDVLEVLKQEPCEDVISRQELDKALYEHFHEEDSPNNITDVRLGAVRNFVRNFPPATPKPKIGHWVLTDVEGYKVWHCNCSECDKDPQDYIGGSEDWWLIKSKLPKFCPNCGAKMEVEE